MGSWLFIKMDGAWDMGRIGMGKVIQAWRMLVVMDGIVVVAHLPASPR